MTLCLLDLTNEHITMHVRSRDLARNINKLVYISNTVGCINGTHKQKYPQALMSRYLNRKNYHLINVQGICYANLNSLHYGKMAKLITRCYYLGNSALNRLFETGIIAEGCLLEIVVIPCRLGN